MHEQFLLAALDQAWLGRGLCAPNPSVGAVAVHNGQIIAQTWHRGAGSPHAEQLLLEQLPQNIADLSLYVTLEPCNHWGRTPPCVDAIIRYGVKRVVYAYSDPNPIVMANNTPGFLTEQGVEIIHHPLPQIDAFYESYRHWTLTKQPWVTVKLAQSLDGKIAGKQGARVHLSNASCAVFTHQKRLHSDIILTTAETVNQDDPLLNVRLSEVDLAKPVAILDAHGRINPDAKLFKTAKHCHIYYHQDARPPAPTLNCSYHPLPMQEDGLDLRVLLQHLGGLGYHDLWVEAGARLFNALHRLDLVNRSYIYLAPAILGEEAVSAYHQADLFSQAKQVTWQPMGDNVVAIIDWSSQQES